MCVCAHVCVYSPWRVWGCQRTTWSWFFSFPHVGPRDQTLVIISLDDKFIYPQSYLTAPNNNFDKRYI